jgi:hypothetical protein
MIGLFINLRIVNAKNAELAENNRRITANMIQLTGEKLQITNQVYRLQELNGSLRLEVEKLADSLRVKPKYITRIEYRTITETDTVKVPVYVNPLSKDTWTIQDTGKCFTWCGVAKLTAEDLSVVRTGFEYSNKITEVFYRKKPAGFFGFLKRRENYHSVTPECGSATISTFEFIK